MHTGSRHQQWPHHLVRYGIPREAKYLADENYDTYDMLVINGTSAAYMPSALTSFLSVKLFRKPFMIDPMTHAFQHATAHLTSSATGDPKKSVIKLAEILGEPFSSRLSSSTPISPSDFRGQVADEVVERVVSFQTDGFRRSADQSGDMDYLAFVNAAAVLRPRFVVAPYFYMDEANVGDWASLNASMAQLTVLACGPSVDVLAQLVIHQGLMESDDIQGPVDAILSTDVAGVALWIDALDETKASARTLRAYLRLLRKIGSTKPIYILYGSYLPTALSHLVTDLGIVGVCHGLEYGENRAVIPVGGGLPISKFYFPSLHARVPFDDALRLARDSLGSCERFMREVCSCRMCATLLDEHETPEEAFMKYGETNPVRMTRRGQSFLRNFPTMDARDRCVRHYMYCKHEEFTESSSLQDVVEQLESAGRDAMDRIGSPIGRHCRIWARVLQGAAHGEC